MPYLSPLLEQDTLSHLCPDIAFYSAAGIDIEMGATCFNLRRAAVEALGDAPGALSCAGGGPQQVWQSAPGPHGRFNAL
jgi:hypothetical protein